MSTDRRCRPTAALWALVAVAAGCGGTPTAPPAAAGPPASSASSAVAAPASPAPEAKDPGDIPDNQVFVPFTTPDGAVVVSVPEGWARSGDGPATIFTDKYNSVRVEVAPRSAPPDATGARSTDVPQLQGTTPGFTLGDVRAVQRKAGSAVLITYEADSTPNAVTGRSVRQSVERYVFWSSGRQAVLTLSGAKGADNVDPWRIVSDSLRWRG